MSFLKHVEHAFQDYLLNGSTDINQHVLGTSKVPLDIRLGIYSHAYRARLYDALITSYPMLHVYLGDEVFETLAYEYINEHPSLFRSIRWYGDEFANFIQQHSQYEEYPYLEELARFEWTLALAFDAANAPVLQMEEIHFIPADKWETMRFQVHPSVHCLSHRWNITSLWQALSENQDPPEPEYSSEPVPFIIWRQDHISQFASVNPDEIWGLQALMNQYTFGEFCAGLCQWVEEEKVGFHAASLLKGWLSAGLITSVSVGVYDVQ